MDAEAAPGGCVALAAEAEFPVVRWEHAVHHSCPVLAGRTSVLISEGMSVASVAGAPM